MKKVLCGGVILGVLSMTGMVTPNSASAAASRETRLAAQPGSKADKSGKQAQPGFVTATKAVPAGSGFELGVHFKIDKGYHLYWKGQNDSGLPMGVELKLPAGWKAGAIQWPAPIRHLFDGDSVDHIYENGVTLIIPIQVPAEEKPETQHEITAEVSWMVCAETCAMGSASIKTTIGISPVGGKPEATGEGEILAAARKRMPKPLPAGGPIKAELSQGNLVITGAAGQKLEFYPHESSVLVDDVAKSCIGEGRLSVKVKKANPGQTEVSGILQVRGMKPEEEAFYWVAIPVAPVQPEPPKSGKP